MYRNICIAAYMATLILAAGSASADCDHSRNISVEPVDASGIRLVRIDASSGFLHVTGTETESVRVHGEACASSQSRLDGIELFSELRGDTLEIRVEIDSARGFFFRRSHASLDLEVELPEGMAVEIEDGSGEIEVRDVGDLEIEDGSGSITVIGCGNTRIDDGSGSIDVRDLRGNLEIEDGSGRIDIEDVAGTVRIDDGSGSIDITRVGGSVVIEDDGSGSIRITKVDGDLRVGDHGSGGLSFDEIGGSVSVRD